MENGNSEGENRLHLRRFSDVPVVQSVPFIPPVNSESSVRVIPPTELMEIGEKRWENAVVAQFVGCSPIPNLSALKKASNLHWGNESVVDLKPLGSNLFLINFLSSEVRDDVIEGSPWDVQNASLIVRRWVPEMESLELKMDRLPVWVHLSNIPLEFFHPKGIEYIASAIGVFLYTDRITANQQRLDFARVCIEIEAKDIVRNEIEVVLKSGKLVNEQVTVPWMPLSCIDRNIFGHDDRNCPSKAAAMAVDGHDKGKGKGKTGGLLDIQISSEANKVAGVSCKASASASASSSASCSINRFAQLQLPVEDKMVEGGKTGIEEQLSVVLDKIMSWDSSPDEANIEYLKAVDEARKLTERLETQCCRARDVLQMAVQRLEEKFKHMLVQHRQPFDSVDVLEKYIIDLVDPDVIPGLKGIANLMFMCNHDITCRLAYVNVRKDALDECLFNLEVEKLSINEDVLRMEWSTLNSKIKIWALAMKVFVRSLLVSEKWLCDQIFVKFGSEILEWFFEAAKAPMLLLNFARAISVVSHQPENLVQILYMYEVLADLVPDIDSLFLDKADSFVRIEYDKVLKRLGDSARASFLEFKNAVESNTSTSCFAGTKTPYFTRYVMNNILFLVDYKDTLNLLLKDKDQSDMISKDLSASFSPMEHQFQLLASILEKNIYEKSELHTDASSQHFFVMNNIHYMVEKVKNSELRLIFGDNWISMYYGKVEQHAMDYKRATWCPILSILKDEERTPQERLKSFYFAFKEVYETQTTWFVPDAELRKDLRISISYIVVQAYQTFVGRQKNHIDEKHMIKYDIAEHLQVYFSDLFKGIPKIIAESP